MSNNIPSFTNNGAGGSSGSSGASSSLGGSSLGTSANLNQGGGNNVANLLGLGQFQVNPYQINSQAFVNPVGNQAGNWNNAMQSYLGANTAQAPTLAQTNTSMIQPGYQGQLGVAQQYQDLANGEATSAASQSAAMQGQQNYAQQMSMLGSARGSSNPAAAQYAAQNALTQGQQQVAQNAVTGNANEQLGALSGAGTMYGNAANTGTSVANLQQNQSIAQAGVTQNQQNINQQAWNQYLNQLAAQNNAQYSANMAQQQLAVNQNLGAMQIAQNAYQNAQQNQGAFTGGLLGAFAGNLQGGAAGMASSGGGGGGGGGMLGGLF